LELQLGRLVNQRFRLIAGWYRAIEADGEMIFPARRKLERWASLPQFSEL
jgi:hypothetical protein